MSAKNQLTAEQIQAIRKAIDSSEIEKNHKEMLLNFIDPQKQRFFIGDKNVLTLYATLLTLIQVKQDKNEDPTEYSKLYSLVIKQLSQPELNQPIAESISIAPEQPEPPRRKF